MNKLLIISLIVLLVSCTERIPPDPVPQNIRPAKLMKVEGMSSNAEYSFTARLEALQTIDLSFEVGGPLQQLLVKEGETVSSGSLVAALDPTEFQLALNEQEVQLKLAALDLNRKRKVLADNGIAKSVVEDAQSQHELQTVRLHKARERLDDSRIQAPFEAYVSRRYVDNFVNVSPSQPIVKLHDLTQLQVVMSIPENLVATVGREQLLHSWVEFSFAPGRRFEISLHENRGEADSLAQTYEVSFTMQNPEDLNLLPGMTAKAHLQIMDSGSKSFLLPSSAIVPATDGSLSVWVFDPVSQSVSRRLITAEAPTESGVPITHGLVEGEQIVVAGASQLQEGMLVRALK